MENTDEMFRLALAGLVVVTEYCLVLVSVLADLWSGIRKARKRGEARRSEALRRTVGKLSQYYNVMLSLTVVDAMQMGLVSYVRLACQWNAPVLPVFTVIGALGIAAIEVKSIFEKAEEKTQKDMTQAAVLMLETLKTLKDKGAVNMDVMLQKLKDNKS